MVSSKVSKIINKRKLSWKKKTCDGKRAREVSPGLRITVSPPSGAGVGENSTFIVIVFSFKSVFASIHDEAFPCEMEKKFFHAMRARSTNPPTQLSLGRTSRTTAGGAPLPGGADPS